MIGTTREADELEVLWREARALARRRSGRQPTARRLPPLLFFTDPDRTPDPVANAERLPKGAGVVFRHFGRTGAAASAMALAGVAKRRGLILLIGDDERLAEQIGADGLHLPERRLAEAPRLKVRHPRWIITAAAHSTAALAFADRVNVHAAVVSPIFPSRSTSAGAPLGPTRLVRMVRESNTPIYGLGGVTSNTIRILRAIGLAGVAAVEGIALPR